MTLRIAKAKFGIPPVQASSDLAQAAAATSPGSWSLMATAGLSAAIDDTEGSGSASNILPFMNHGCWDAGSRRLFLIGGDHDGESQMRFIQYDENINQWSVPSNQPPATGELFGHSQGHGYSMNWLDPVNRRFGFNWEHVYDIDGDAWSNPPTPSDPATRAHEAFAYTPGGVLRYRDSCRLQRWVDGTNFWGVLQPNNGFAPNTGNAGEMNMIYNPRSNLVLFGGTHSSFTGNSELWDQLWTLSGSDVAAEPVALNTETPYDANGISCHSFLSTSTEEGVYMIDNPTNGKFLFWGGNEATDFTMYELDAVADVWAALPASSNVPFGGDWNDCAVFSVPTYGVVVVIRQVSVGTSQMWLYKPPANPPASLRFFGDADNDTGRVKFGPVYNPSVAINDAGAGGFTVDVWIRPSGVANDNPLGNSVTRGADVDWITGNIFFDRDLFSNQPGFGMSLCGGRLCAGGDDLSNNRFTLIGSNDLRDDAWHLCSMQIYANGDFELYEDGVLVDSESGAFGASFVVPDGHTPVNQCGINQNLSCEFSDRFMVFGAEKHDFQGPLYDYTGLIGPSRYSNSTRYTSAGFTPPNSLWAVDGATVGLWPMDDDQGGLTVRDASGNNLNGTMQQDANGPIWTSDSPFA